MTDLNQLKQRIIERDYTVGIIGLGYVGLPLLLRFFEVGFKVVGFDVDPNKVAELKRGKSYIKHIDYERVATLAGSSRFEATTDFNRLGEADTILICVPTPLNRHREPDLQYIEKATDAIARTLRPGQLVCLESTTYPGTTEEIILPRLKVNGFEIGEQIFLAFSPEREDPGNKHYTTANVPKIVGGVTYNCLDLACTLYAQITKEVIPVSSTRVAEAAKLLENIYRAVNIALVNELKITFDHMGIDIWEVIEAASTKPFGFQAFYPGPGLGGHCIPIDPFYLAWKAREFGIVTRFIELAGEVNWEMPSYVVNKVTEALNNYGKAVKGSRILVLGVSYKKDVDDLRESPALEIIEILLSKGAIVEYSDPYFPNLPTVRRHALNMNSVDLKPEVIKEYDALVVATDHSSFPYDMIYNEAQLIIDSRGAFRRRGYRSSKIVNA